MGDADAARTAPGRPVGIGDRSAIELADHFREVVDLELDLVGETVAGNEPNLVELFIRPAVFGTAMLRPRLVPRVEALPEICGQAVVAGFLRVAV